MSGRPGLFLTLEGGEGAGKSTLAQALKQVFEATGRQVVLTREPGGTAGADAIRGLLVSGSGDRWSPMAELLLVTAAREDHLRRLIRPALAAGAVVICDRFTDSTKAYQAGGGGVSLEAVVEATRLIDAPIPDLTLLLDIEPDEGLARSRGTFAGEDRFEGLGRAFHERVRAAFLALAALEPERIVVLDAGADAQAVFSQAISAINGRFGLLA